MQYPFTKKKYLDNSKYFFVFLGEFLAPSFLFGCNQRSCSFRQRSDGFDGGVELGVVAV